MLFTTRKFSIPLWVGEMMEPTLKLRRSDHDDEIPPALVGRDKLSERSERRRVRPIRLIETRHLTALPTNPRECSRSTTAEAKGHGETSATIKTGEVETGPTILSVVGMHV